jgi:hypothetical protein
MFENAPSHLQLQYANTTLNWCSTDSEQEFEKNLKNTQQYELLDKNGWIDRNIEYSFNSYGFRSREIDTANPGFAVLGCSFTSGIGLPVDDLWPVRLSKKLSIPVDNLGVQGASNGLMFRIAHYWLPKVKPKFVILQQTFKERFEIIDQRNTSIMLMPGHAFRPAIHAQFKDWWYTDANSIVDQQRNEFAIRHVCQQLEIPVIVIDVDKFINLQRGDKARDLQHAGSQTHNQASENFFKQLTTMNIL